MIIVTKIVFLSTLKRKGGVFQILQVEERFLKSPFSCRISADIRHDRGEIAAFANFSGIVCTESNQTFRGSLVLNLGIS